MTEKNHPFRPGTRVVIFRPGMADEAFVDKLYKHGNFTLCGSMQQWKPRCFSNKWSAVKTGDAWSRESVYLWDDKSEQYERIKLRERWRDLIKDITDPTVELCDAVEAILKKQREPNDQDQ